MGWAMMWLSLRSKLNLAVFLCSGSEQASRVVIENGACMAGARGRAEPAEPGLHAAREQHRSRPAIPHTRAHRWQQ